MRASRFAEFLLSQVPIYDKLIIKDIRPMDGWFSGPRILPIDVRLLPNRLRIAYCHNTKYISDCLGVSRRSAGRLKLKSYQIIANRLEAWIRKLPQKQRRIEKQKRNNKLSIQTTDWGRHLDRLNAVFPDVSKEWK